MFVGNHVTMCVRIRTSPWEQVIRLGVEMPVSHVRTLLVWLSTPDFSFPLVYTLGDKWW